MLRILLFVLLAGLLVIGAVWIAEHPGIVALNWLGWHIETSIMVLLITLVVLIGLLLFFSRFFGGILGIPQWWRRRRNEKKLRRGSLAVGEGIAAARGGDVHLARKLLKDAERLLPGAAGTQQLTADTAAAAGETDVAEKAYGLMLENPRTQASGRRGLLDLALTRGDLDKAYAIVREAVATGVDAPWATATLFRLQLLRRQWADAESTLAKAGNGVLKPGDDAKVVKAALLTVQARDAELPGRGGDALRLSQQAVELDPTSREATLIAARQLAATGRQRKAAQLLIALWAKHPHPSLAQAYLALWTGEDSLKIVRHAQELTGANPEHPMSRRVFAEAALDAQLWGEARQSLEPLLRDVPSATICRLMARLEEGEKGDVTAANQWLRRALEAGPEVEEDGVTALAVLESACSPFGTIAAAERKASGGRDLALAS
ncbi:heme biosynthesis protein HemY [Rhodospirillum rubrum]|uniref:HemY-like n=1 Tax=Rhodospirillum rubrum (strain ATCC 11170 / ATH 1.1.1 / DSM 467 / LMG 4362 / NCIMB 8255 / S1) TaxID=269796 RepID=Q2RND5_RHORT|nr:heme biosynthesis HemY N-terminal domain-containing protein [Rhodospirillum rubrum]ABC24360.1 HemY-like [Rhodospirillum rubrum ATCC 11170]AEO50111.1 HemY-like protein [Rhodospirillum rubrum F11]MBK5956082.1 heme biosynthesis protein HemY [Rhodospirillum rubrum]QXG80285.1 heme biosynthesis protein HemY [Rhodospirillum rubrum]HCF18592.1 heme biosynthesis protein HemY [Rhodospirillum rubrum]